MSNQFDIRNHKWSDEDAWLGVKSASNDHVELFGFDWLSSIKLNKDDAEAIAKHFGIFDDIKEWNGFGDRYDNIDPQWPRSGHPDNTTQSETDHLNSTKANKERLEESIKQFEHGEIVKATYKTLNLDSVGEMSNNELFDKGSDSHE